MSLLKFTFFNSTNFLTKYNAYLKLPENQTPKSPTDIQSTKENNIATVLSLILTNVFITPLSTYYGAIKYAEESLLMEKYGEDTLTSWNTKKGP